MECRKIKKKEFGEKILFVVTIDCVSLLLDIDPSPVRVFVR